MTAAVTLAGAGYLRFPALPRPGSDDREQALAVLPVTARSMYEVSTRPAEGEPGKTARHPIHRLLLTNHS
jgi:hypothetical protein